MNFPTLYHSTTTKRFESIWAHGLVPGNGDGTMGLSWPTRPGYVYLTSANAVHYAVTAWYASGGNFHEHMLCVEVDGSQLELSLVYPDDEYIASQLGLAPDDYKQHATRTDCDPKAHQDKWAASLSEMRSVGYAGVVPPSAISRFAIISSHAIVLTPLGNANPRASTLANLIAGDVSAALARYIFDGDSEAFLAARTAFICAHHPEDDAAEQASAEVRSLSRSRYVTVVENRPGTAFPGIPTV